MCMRRNKVTGSLFGFPPRIAGWPVGCLLIRFMAPEVCVRTPRMPIWGQARYYRRVWSVCFALRTISGAAGRRVFSVPET